MAELKVAYSITQGPTLTRVYSNEDTVVVEEASAGALYFSVEAAELLMQAIEGTLFDINEKLAKKDEN
jgi:hypothetical protein